MDEETIEAIELVLNDYFDQLEDLDTLDTQELAENIARHLERRSDAPEA